VTKRSPDRPGFFETADRFELGHILFIDIAGYSTLK
jgi:hypothetical protein